MVESTESRKSSWVCLVAPRALKRVGLNLQDRVWLSTRVTCFCVTASQKLGRQTCGNHNQTLKLLQMMIIVCQIVYAYQRSLVFNRSRQAAKATCVLFLSLQSCNVLVVKGNPEVPSQRKRLLECEQLPHARGLAASWVQWDVSTTIWRDATLSCHLSRALLGGARLPITHLSRAHYRDT
eukprot:4361421-Amphidinium_carterae.1